MAKKDMAFTDILGLRERAIPIFGQFETDVGIAKNFRRSRGREQNRHGNEGREETQDVAHADSVFRAGP